MKTIWSGKKTRWDVALETLDQVLGNLPDDFNVGLRMYGHREPSPSPKTCTDSELLVPDRASSIARSILTKAKTFKPKGETPLVYSALQSPADLKAVGGGTVILITDGEESCKGDPVKAAAELKASGLDIRLNIVGFALKKNPKVQKDLAGFSRSHRRPVLRGGERRRTGRCADGRRRRQFPLHGVRRRRQSGALRRGGKRRATSCPPATTRWW